MLCCRDNLPAAGYGGLAVVVMEGGGQEDEWEKISSSHVWDTTGVQLVSAFHVGGSPNS